MTLENAPSPVREAGALRSAVAPRVSGFLGTKKGAEHVAGLWTEQLWQRTLVRSLVLADALTVLLGLALSLRAVVGHSHSTSMTEWMVATAAFLAWPAALAAVGAYEMRFLGLGTDEFKRIAVVGFCLTSAFAAGTIATADEPTRTLAVYATAGLTLLLLAERGIGRSVLSALRRRGSCQHRVVLVGVSASVRSLIADVDRARALGWHVVAACVPAASAQESISARGTALPIAGVDRAVAMAALYGADTIAVTDQHVLADQGLRKLAWDLEGTAIQLLISSTLTDIAAPRVTVRPLPNLPLLHVDQPQFTGAQRVYKTVADRLLAALALVVLSPVIAAIALAIKLGDPGPVFFRQERIGIDERAFTCFKFRSMRMHAEDMFIDLSDGGVMFKIKADPRVTKVGGFLRRTSLDELPQLINVLLGSMSLVGPRPQVQSEVDVYEKHHHRRLLVKPGMTGLWQVNGRSDLPWEQAVRLDLYYVENWSPLLDLRILARTFQAVAKGSGAY